MPIRTLLMLALFATAGAAAAEDRELCPQRPGLDTPPCIVDKGRLLVETGIADWTREDDGPMRTDTVELGDTLLRLGLTETLEAQLEWVPYGHVRERDRSTGERQRQSGVGDVTVGLKQNLVSADGSGTSFALLPYATLPTGGHAIGAGTWGAGLLVPVSFELGKGLALLATPEIDAEPDEDRSGRHLAYGSAAGVQAKLSEAVSASAEVQLIRDEDPEGHETQALAGVTFAWQPGKDLQLDTGANLGLNHDTPDAELFVGISRRF